MKNSKKAVKSGTRRSPDRPRSPRSVEDYMARIPEPARRNFEVLRATVRGVVPDDAIEVISYGIPAFRRGKVLVWFAAFADHCSLFPTASVIEDFREELAKYRVSKGTIQFPLEKPIPTALVKKLVKARVAKLENRKP